MHFGEEGGLWEQEFRKNGLQGYLAGLGEHETPSGGYEVEPNVGPRNNLKHKKTRFGVFFYALLF